ncbi:Heat shock 70 kDa protein 12A [Mactra antiquata]
MAEMKSHCTRLLVAAMDFGTTYSGYAFSFRDKPLDIQTNPNWHAGSEKLISLKNPTCVLLKPNKEFHSFGFEAENKYGDLAEDDEHHGWYFFRRFKMALYETDNLTSATTIEDIAGKKMPALTVFTHAVRYLKDHLLNTLDTKVTDVSIEDIQFVITVPAIWDEKAKQFMRLAATSAGIKNDQLRIALEPEAASIWCQVETDNNLCVLSHPGSKYMVVDLGGGTADITVHQKKEDGTLKEIHKATGGAWGGNEVDKAYIEMLTKLSTTDAMQEFKTTQMADYFDIHRDFETKKRSIKSDDEGKVTIKIPASLRELATKHGATKKKDLGKDISWTGDKLRMQSSLIRQLFDGPIQVLIKHVEDLLSDPIIEDIDAILLVGGFGECQLVNAAFRRAFYNMQLIVPNEPGLAVLKGAVRFGHLPEIVSVRVSRYAYGREVWPAFDENVHPSSKRSVQLGKPICKEVFYKIVSVGEEIPFGKEVKTLGSAINVGQMRATINLYSSLDENPMFITTAGCKFLGNVGFDLPDSKNLEDKNHTIFLTFGDTELKCRVVIDKTKKEVETTIKCL